MASENEPVRSTDSHQLIVTDGEDIPGDTSSEGTLTLGTTIDGTVDESYDQDWYRFDVRAGRTYAFDLVDAGVGDTYLRLFDNDENELAENDDYFGLNSRIVYAANTDGLIFVSAGGFDTNTGSYRLCASELTDAIPGSTDTEATLAIGGSATGVIDYRDDSDWFRVEVEAGKTYVFDLEGVATGVGTLADPYLRLLDADGNEMRADSDGGTDNNARLGFSATADGPVYVDARGWETGTYRLSAAEIVGEVPDNTATEAVLAVGGSVTGAIDWAGDNPDSDWFRIEVEAGRTYVVDLEGAANGAGTLEDPYLRLHDADGNEVRSDGDGGIDNNARLGFTATADGPVYVDTRGYETGTYRLSAREVVGDQADSTTTQATLAIGGSVTGTVDWAGDNPDSDWFRIEVEAGRTYVVDLEGAATGAGTLADPYLRLLDADGNEVRSDGDGAVGLNARLGFTANTDGPVYVDARGWETGSYRLSASEIVGDQPDNDTTTTTVAVGGTVRGNIDFGGDEDWFRVEVQANHTYKIDVEGLADLDGSLSNPFLSVADGARIRENFLELYSDGSWNDAPADGYRVNNSFVVELESEPESSDGWVSWDEDEGGNAHYYRVVVLDNAVDWYQARQFAESTSQGAHLASVNSAEENSLLYQLMQQADGRTGQTWLGGFQSDPQLSEEPADGWAWVTNEAFEFVGWGYGEPNDALGGHFELISNNDGGIGNNAQSGYTASADGSWLIRVRGDGSDTGTYTIRVGEVLDDVTSDSVEASPLSIGGHLRSRVDFADDTDAFRVEVEAGTTYVFDLKGAASGSGSLIRPYLTLSDAGGNEVASDQGSGIGTNARIVYTAEADGDLLLTARGAGEDEQGTYAIRASEDLGGRLTDLPRLHAGKALPEAAIQPQSLLQAGDTADLQLTYLGGRSAHDSAIGVFTVSDQGQMQDLRILAPTTQALSDGESFSLQGGGPEFGVVVIPRAADLIAGLADLKTGELVLRNPDTGDIARSWDDAAPQLIRIDCDRPALVDARILFAHDNDPGSLENPLNPGGWVQATGGRVWRTDGSTDFRVLAFETGEAQSGRASSDFDDLVLAIGDGPLSAADLAWTQHYLFV